MGAHNTEIAPCLAAWIERQMPEVGGLRGVRIRCCDSLPFEWLPGFMPNIAGITLWSTVYLRPRYCPIDPSIPALIDLLLHELVHVGQFRRAPLLFPIRYLIDLARFGYWDIPAEREARDRAKELMELYRSDPPC